MPISPTPDLSTIQQRMESDVDHYIPGAALRPRFSVLRILTKVYAAGIHALYQYAWGLMRNILPSTCHDDWLPAWAYVLRVPRREAMSAQGQGMFAGEGLIPLNTELQGSDGFLYRTEHSTETGRAVALIAAEPGAAYNTNEASLKLKHPISGVELEVAITEPLSGGMELETLAEWRERIVERFANRQKIGDADDHIDLVKQIDPAMRYVWVYGNTPALGQITIICALAGVNPRPSYAQLENIRTQLVRKHNVGAEVILAAPEFTTVPFRILSVPEAARTNVFDALLELFNSLRTQNATLYESDIHAAIRQVYGGVYSVITPNQDITAPDNHLLTMAGEPTWQ